MRWATPLKIFILLGLGVAVYSNAFHSPFVFDDIYYIVRNPSLKHLDNISTIFWGSYAPLRFIPFLSFALNYHFYQLDVFGYHVVNVAIHILNAGLVWWFAYLTMRSPLLREKAIARHAPAASFAAALLFLVHPLATQSVTYICQRFTSLATLFYVLTLCFYAAFRLKKQWGYLLGVFLGCAGAVLSKQIALTLPVMIIVYDQIFFPGTKRRKWLLWAVPVAIALSIPAYYSFNVAGLFSVERPSSSHIGDILTPMTYFLTQFRVILTYLKLLVFPLKQNFIYDYPMSTSLQEPETAFSMLMVCFLLAFAIGMLKFNRLIGFGLLWFFITLSIESSAIVIGHVIFEHRTYLPSIGIFLALSAVVFTFNRKVAIFLVGLAVLVLSFLTYQRNKTWSDPVTFWSDNVQKSPRMVNPNLNLGVAYAQQGEYEKAIAQYEKVFLLAPDNSEAFNNRGVSYMRLGQHLKALQDFNKALDLDPYYFNAYHNRGTQYAKMKEYTRALNDLNKALEMNPSHPESYNERGTVYLFLGKTEEALEDFTKAVFFDPNYAKAYNNRGATYNTLGEFTIAIRDFKSAVALDPHFAAAYYNLSYSYYKLDDINQARHYLQKALDLGYQADPGYVEELNK
ncbi:MAG TPA: tetratricopeptide repeat protein [Candidatus Omnitrophota bacterium]|nr:tetratricopeptide repeat protein [Candidatus Omnitrophota bacterium]